MHCPTSWSGTQKSTAGMDRLAHEIAPQAALMVTPAVPSPSVIVCVQIPLGKNLSAVTGGKTHISARGYPHPDDLPSHCYYNICCPAGNVLSAGVSAFGHAVTADNVSRSGSLSGHQRIKFDFRVRRQTACGYPGSIRVFQELKDMVMISEFGMTKSTPVFAKPELRETVK